MNIKKFLVGLVVGVLMVATSIVPAFAVANWTLTAPNALVFTCGGGNYPHTLLTVNQNPDGTFTGTGHYDSDTTYLWNITGTITGDTITYQVMYTGANLGYTLNGTGTVANDGSISGSVDNNCQSFTMPAGTATAIQAESKKVTGGLTLGSPKQQISFNAFDNGASSADKGTVEYQNFTYPGGLHYTADVLCANVNKSTHEAWFMFQIPAGYPGLSGVYVVSYVKDLGSPGTKGDTYGHTASGDLATAKNWCEAGNAFVGLYPVTGGNAVVHK
jgi:hypothetical protein